MMYWIGIDQLSVQELFRTRRKGLSGKPPNGLRYPLVGETGERYFAGANFKPHKLPENAQSPTSRVHAVLGVLLL
jgi:hypothetical protein